MFRCEVIKTPPYARNFVYSELLNLQTVTFPLGLMGTIMSC